MVAYGRDRKIYKLKKQGDKMELEELKINIGEAQICEFLDVQRPKNTWYVTAQIADRNECE